MRIRYKNRRLERILIAVNVLAAVAVAVSFAMLFGFDKALLPANFLYSVQAVLLFIFIIEKLVRLYNAVSTREFLHGFWIQIPLLIALAISVAGAGRWFGKDNPTVVQHFAVGIFLVLQVVIKVCRTVVNLAASGTSPTWTLIASFLVLIISGAGLLMLPKSAVGENVSLVDALFTATSATCVTGLVVRDTGGDFSLMGQLVILSLIQLGGLGIVMFGAVFALLLGQALSVRESVAMQDLLSARTLGQIGKMIAFIFVGTFVVEIIGVFGLFGMWDDVPGRVTNVQQRWFFSVFHSVSAFCNAGFSLFRNSFVGYNKSWSLYAVVCPLIVLGGLGFGVLYDMSNIAADRVGRFFKKLFNKHYRFSMEAPRRMQLQSKIVLSVSTFLIVGGALAIILFERFAAEAPVPSRLASVSGCASVEFGVAKQDAGVLEALFQSITARTAGFNTVDISSMSASSRFILILLMFVGGSPGSTAGGIKTVTLAVVIMTAFAALRRRQEVEMFRRSVRMVVVGRAITVTLLFVVVLFAATLALSITENANGFAMSDIIFEAASALGTVGLTTGITPSLTDWGKVIIIVVMLVGRLGPLTLLAALTFNLKPAKYNYPAEAVIVG